MSEKELHLDDSHQKLMELLVSRTLRKHGFKKDSIDLTEREKKNLKETVELLQKQSQSFIDKQNNITEQDVNPITNVYDEGK
ncbi:hypothetical protein [Peribacillus loiseleuriae]|uniref:Uncharacterized protein n=1 Tax=Peribacillus loiseleuriae TaxID=1679170 RepID=A0A0K9GRA3_9BACI|nr:hypothetical protein [Peribacillus loiseleuriae]KMY49121.1 hypothetical protein AC625_05975 [Peribacillus loiseleuriae]